MPLSLDGTTGISASGNITGNNVIASGTLTAGTFSPTSLNASGNVAGGNLLTAGLITATSTITSSANITGGNLLTAGLITATSTITSSANITGGNILTAGIVTATGNIQGGNLRTAGLVSATGSITTAGDISITGNIVDGAALTIITSSNGNITMAPNGTGVVVVNTDIRNGQASGTGNIGASGATFNTIFAKATSAQYADLAEMYESDTQVEPGQLVEFGGSKDIQKTTTSHSTQVAGIISTSPAYIMNSALTPAVESPHVVPVALTGRVPCLVIGKINKGDRLVSSHIPGIATVLDLSLYQPGCIVGKALEDYDSQNIGRIEVAVGRF
jgi:trimeric autotransporter adhesin